MESLLAAVGPESGGPWGEIVLTVLTALISFLTADKVNERRKQRNGGAYCTQSQFKTLEGKFEMLVKTCENLGERLNLFWSERRRDMDFLMTHLEKPPPRLPDQMLILLIEDDPNDRMLIRRRLGPNFEVDEAETMAQAFSMIKQRNYDCVILDLSLPDCYGEGTLRSFRSQCPAALAIVSTGNTDPKLVRIASELGYEATVFKGEHSDEHEYVRKIRAAVLRHK